MSVSGLDLDALDLQTEATRFIGSASRLIGTFGPGPVPVVWIDAPVFVAEILFQNLEPVLRSVAWPGAVAHVRNRLDIKACATAQSLILHELHLREELMSAVLDADNAFSFIYGNSHGRINLLLQQDGRFHPSVFHVKSLRETVGTPMVLPTRAWLERELGRALTTEETAACQACLTLDGMAESWQGDRATTSIRTVMPYEILMPSTQVPTWQHLAGWLLHEYSTRFEAILAQAPMPAPAALQ